MNGEVAQICDIAIYARHALKTKNKISYKPSKYENKIEFLFTENFKAKDVNEWYEHCIEKGLEDIKLSMPIAVKDPSLLAFSNTSQAGLVCYFKDNVVGKLRKIKEYYGSSYFKEVDENKIDKIFNSEKNDTKEKIVKLVELINDTAIRLIQEIKSSHFSTEIEVNVDKFYSYVYFERYLLNNLRQIDIEMKDLREKINVEIEKYK